jgi:hypothetical protein
MDEEQWLASEDSEPMLRLLDPRIEEEWLASEPQGAMPHSIQGRPRTSDRKLRLFCCACGREEGG